MPDVIMADVIMADAPPLKRQRGDAVLVGKNIISSRILKYGYREHQVCFMLVASKDRQFITKVNKTDAWAALQKGIHLPVLQMQPCHITELNLLRVFLEWLVDLVDWAKRTACLQLIV